MTRSPRPRPGLDKVDRAIIEQLQADGRAPYTKLSAAVGLSEAAVRQRVQRLLEAGVMDKLAFGGVVQAAGLDSLPRAAFDPDRAPDFPGPYIVKPRFGGSSIGIEITDDLSAVSALVRTSPHYRAGAVIEPYLADAVDLNISVLTHPEVRLSAIERPLRGDARIYSYADKYLGGEGMASAKRELPAVVPETVATAINDSARRVVEVALVRSVARIDFLWASDHIYVNEINTIPGSLAWYFWANEGLGFGALLAGMRARLRPHLTAVYHLVDRSLPFGRY